MQFVGLLFGELNRKLIAQIPVYLTKKIIGIAKMRSGNQLCQNVFFCLHFSKLYTNRTTNGSVRPHNSIHTQNLHKIFAAQGLA